MHRRDVVAAAVVAVLASAAIGLIASERLAGLSIDLLFWLREAVVAPYRDPSRSPTVVVALDEETHRRPPFADVPKALWMPQLAVVLDALIEGGAKVVGFDAIFPTSVEMIFPQSPDPRVAGLDRDFLRVLYKAARQDKVVLAKVLHQGLPIRPFPGQAFVVGGERSVLSANLYRDVDEVIRRVSLTFESEDGKGGMRSDNSISLELAARALGQRPVKLDDGGLALGSYRIPGSEHDTMLVNFAGGDSLPTFSFADLHECAKQGKSEFFRQQFKDKVVLIGTVVDLEDRQVTSKRFITTHEQGSTAARCVVPPMAGLYRNDLVRDTIPGVYIQASAVNNLLRRDALREIAPWAGWLLIALTSCAAAAVTMTLSPLAAAGAVLAASLLWIAAATFAFSRGLVLPLLTVPPAAALTLAILIGYRFAVTDRARRLLRNSFALYLAPSVIDRMVEAERLPELGGEDKLVTVMFSDLEGFTALSERLSPSALVELMNDYLTAMTDIIETQSGFVGRYIGDAIDSVFGAPVDDELHAFHAVRAALACIGRLAVLNGEGAFRGNQLRARIGLNTGEALVGNIGSRKRFNYTVMGDTVNLASRLEGANKIYGTVILAAESVRIAAGDGIEWREIDRVRVKGRGTPVAIFEPLGLAGKVAPERQAVATAFAAGLAAYRAGRFAEAEQLFDTIAETDPPARVFAARSRQLQSMPSPMPWDAVTNLETK